MSRRLDARGAHRPFRLSSIIFSAVLRTAEKILFIPSHRPLAREFARPPRFSPEAEVGSRASVPCLAVRAGTVKQATVRTPVWAKDCPG